MTLAEASECEKKELPLKESVGSICAEFVFAYPPGIPVLVPGEVISPEICSLLTDDAADRCKYRYSDSSRPGYIITVHGSEVTV
jgi:arginine/lysine/ornithine decarboxylase